MELSNNDDDHHHGDDPTLELLYCGEGILPLMIPSHNTSFACNPTALAVACVQVKKVAASCCIHQEDLARLYGESCVHYQETETGGVSLTLDETPLVSSSSSRENAARLYLEEHVPTAELARAMCISFTQACAQLPFSLRFQLECFLGFRKDDATTMRKKRLLVFLQVILPPLLELMETTQSNSNDDTLLFAHSLADALAVPLHQVCEAIHKGSTFTFWTETALDQAAIQARERVDNATRLHNKHETPTYCSTWTGVQVQPTRMQLSTERRLWRNLAENVRDRFLVVTVPMKEHEPLLRRMQERIPVCGRSYQYLFHQQDNNDDGESVLELWLYAETETVSVQDILCSIEGGDARQESMAMALSITTPIQVMDLPRIHALPEIIRNGHSFTHGAGVYGIEIAKAIAAQKQVTTLPGAILAQVGGVKGVFSLKKTNFDPYGIGIRSSMAKFSSAETTLEVITTTPHANNNRSMSRMVLLLHQWSCCQLQVFLDMQMKEFAALASVHDNDVDVQNMHAVHDYITNHVEEGLKANGDEFSYQQLAALLDSMVKAQTQGRHLVGSRGVTLLRGIPDEYNVLQDGEIFLPGVTGPVLLCPSLCWTPQGIKKVRAVPSPHPTGSGDDDDVDFDGVFVFSVKGDTPLVDASSDEYYFAVTEPKLARLDAMEGPPHAPEPVSYNELGNIPPTLDIQEWFTTPQTRSSAVEKQVESEALEQALSRGHLQSRLRKAWLCIADQVGATHEDAIQMANLLGQAGDAPNDLVETLQKAESKYTPPHWYSNGTRESFSIVGELHDQWQTWMDQLQQIKEAGAIGQHDVLPPPSTVLSVAPSPAATHCSRDPSLKVSSADFLMDVVFERYSPKTIDEQDIDYRKVDVADLEKLADLVALDLQKEILDNEKRRFNKRADQQPRIHDVFLIKSRSRRGDLVVCVAKQGGGLAFRTKTNSVVKFGDVAWSHRVASLTTKIRVLDALRSNPSKDSLMFLAMQRTGLVNASDCLDGLSEDQCNGMSKEQSQIVAAITSNEFNKGVLLVEGPPGSGKTKVIIETLKRVETGAIVVAPSNAAVANVAKSLLQTGAFVSRDVIVWGENCDESVQFLEPHHRRRKFEKFQSEFHIANGSAKKSLLHNVRSWLRLEDTGHSSYEDIARLCRRPNSATQAAKFVFCTLNNAGSAALRKATQGRFDLVVLDEANQCAEAEFYIAACFPNVQRLLVVGDPMQLRANYKSFLANCIEHYPKHIFKLDVQYRMHPNIFKFCNGRFYSSAVKTHSSTARRLASPTKQLRFVNMAGMTEEKKHGTSFVNEYDAAVISALLHDDGEINSMLRAKKDTKVIVTSPYDAQVQFLRGKLSSFKSTAAQVNIGTVDSFQGQEGDIVIVSLTRTKSVQFSDEHRLNVALTRARSLLVIVGDLQYFRTVSAQGSAIGKLAEFLDQNPSVLESAAGDEAWHRPNWNDEKTLWAPRLTSRFRQSLKSMYWVDNNVAFNTLRAVVMSDLEKLSKRPVEQQKPAWQRSSLKGYNGKLQVVWIPRLSETTSKKAGLIEGHFAGPPKKCAEFVQNNRRLPEYACGINRDLTELIRGDNSGQRVVYESSWPVTNELQDAILDDVIDRLPRGAFALDPEQQKIVKHPLPLLVESRSGTGKTNCLFVHAVDFARALRDDSGAVKTICFVTVSERLSEDLKKRYEEGETIRQHSEELNTDAGGDDAERKEGRLIQFFTFREMLNLLLKEFGATMDLDNTCNFRQYVNQRTSHQKFQVELSLVENEIGGAIMGSLAAATKRRPLTHEEYQNEKRSNIPNDTEEGQKKRKTVYEVYEEYRKFKTSHELYDENDIILALVNLLCTRQRGDIFQSLYLDEVQDFSFAAIFLMCSIAGKDTSSWCAAGDVAQMITPGCAFTFDGMKQTLRAINGAVKLPKAARLLKNYRTSRGVLQVANSILEKLHKYFPHAIGSVSAETAVRDLDFPVTVVSWAKIKKDDGKVKFGVNQAVIYTSDSDDASKKSLKEWTGDHPFTLSSRESKGLEFQDVVVYTVGNKRSAWKTERIECLALLRKLYVAITRAHQRVMIVIGGEEQKRFFESLDCGVDLVFADPSTILMEFDKETSDAEWFQRGRELFQEKKYDLAAGCFRAAGKFGWHHRAKGFNSKDVEKKPGEAKDFFRKAARLFFDTNDFRECLDTFAVIASLPPWSDTDNELLDEAISMEPDYLPRQNMLEVALCRGSWKLVKVDDLWDPDTSSLFLEMQSDPRLVEIARECSREECALVEKELPVLVAGLYLEKGRIVDAIRLYIKSGDLAAAAEASGRALEKLDVDRTVELVECWTQTSAASYMRDKKTRFARIVRLFLSPSEISKKDRRAYKELGHELVKLAVLKGGCEVAEALHSFSRKNFQEDILQDLGRRFSLDLTRGIDWYLERKDTNGAKAFATCNLAKCDNEQILYPTIAKHVDPKSRWAEELNRRGILIEAAQHFLEANSRDVGLAEMLSNHALESAALVTRHEERLRQLWTDKKTDPSVRDWWGKTRAKPSRIRLLLMLFQEPEHAKRRFGGRCRDEFGEQIVRKAEEQVLKKNEVVELFGLLAATHLNGKWGRVRDGNPTEDGRIAVVIEGETRVKTVKRANLRRPQSTSSSSVLPTSPTQAPPTVAPFSTRPQASGGLHSNRDDSDSDSHDSDRGLSSRNNGSDSDSDSDSEEPPPLQSRMESSGEDSSQDSGLPQVLSSLNANNQSTTSNSSHNDADSSASSADSDLPPLLSRRVSADIQGSTSDSSNNVAESSASSADGSDDDLPVLLARVDQESSGSDSESGSSSGDDLRNRFRNPGGVPRPRRNLQPPTRPRRRR